MPKTSSIIPPIPIPKPNPIKRTSSSTSLPTPPHTHRKKRSRSRGSTDGSDSDAAPKRRRAEQVEEQDEEAFWLAGSQPQGPRTPTQSPSPPPPALLQYRSRTLNKEYSLASPPPSRRQSNVMPVTPPRAMQHDEDTGMPVRDSPNNPFLSHGTPTPARVSAPVEEQPTLTYVFRGTKRTYANPHYGLPPSAFANSRLPVSHPDFSPSEKCEPRLLFPGARKKKAIIPKSIRSPTRRKQRDKEIDSDEEKDGEESGDEELKPVELFKGEVRDGVRRSPRLVARV